VFGIGTPFGLGFVCGHGLSLQKDRLGCSNHPGVSTRPEDPALLITTLDGTNHKTTEKAVIHLYLCVQS
jgi:hypothetical protein